jgi:hypothetical protein
MLVERLQQFLVNLAFVNSRRAGGMLGSIHHSEAMRALYGITLALLLGTVGCAPGERAGESAAPRPERNLITLEEIASAERAGSAYDVVQALRPNWLRGRSPGTVQNPGGGAVVVYVDDLRVGGVEHLRSLPSNTIASMRYLDSGDATTRFGTGHMGGAILVAVRRQ